jgi:HlyD family secretion protein
MSENPLFRKAALDKLASPERLDVLMQVTSPMGWLALTTVGGILVGVIIWSILGSIPERIDGQGVLLRGGANSEIRSSGSGSIVSLDLKLNQVVTVGQVVGTTAMAGTNEEVAVAQTRLTEARNRRNSVGLDSRLGVAQAQSQIANLRADLLRQQADLETADANVKRLQKLFDEGGIPSSRLEQAKGARSSISASITGLKGQIGAQEANIRQLQGGAGSVDSEIAMAEAELKRVTAKVGAQEQLVSTVAGRVIEVRKRVGDTIAPNDVVATLEATNAQVQVVAFVGAEVGKRIQVGMHTEVSPTDVKREEYGFMLADVGQRNDFAATSEYVMSQLRNEAIAKKLVGQGPVFEVRAILKEAPDTPSGFAWSTSKGPPFKISGGTLVSIAIVVDRKPPITLVMPFLRKTFGVAWQSFVIPPVSSSTVLSSSGA